MALRPSRVALFALSVSFLVACGGSETLDEPAGGAGSGGTAGAAGAGSGATGGASGASGASGKGGSAGGTGGAGASGGSSGAAGKGGTGGGAGGAGGAAGAGGGTAGKGGASGGKGGAAGASGGAGVGGGASSCKVDTDCTGQIPVTTPAGCAELFCEPTSGACAVRSRDKDKDGHRGAACKAIDGTSIATGDDCDDNDAETHPGAWDGPADGANPDRCDGKDQNCSNEPDDQKTAAGKSCLCNPGDSLVCGEDGGGKTIAFPMLDANGKPVGKCKLGKKTCGGDGKWGPCVGAVPPEKFDICNGGVDDDCDGKADLEDDMAPPNLVTWSYDGDGDGYVDKDDPTAKSSACDDKAPTVCPTSVPSCDLGKWKLGSLPTKDCNDKDGDVNPAGVELCDGIDNDCNGVVDDDYASNASLWYFDWDGDNYGDINTTPKKSCSPPTTFPAGCADLVANTPADYCAGIAGEGNPPTCPVPACDVSMWKKNIPNTDCKDRPDQALSGIQKGSNPTLVYPGATDLCNDRDYNCDGSGTTGCGCSPVGVTKACGAEQTCNLAAQTCVQGGTWDTSQCLPDKARVDYCPDDDSDGYCELTKCVNDVCPGGAPVDGHKYRERTTCLGFSKPNLAGSDCSDDPTKDADAANINVGLAAEVCNGDGKDHNCNGVKNTPGAGDCECNDGDQWLCAASGQQYGTVSTPPPTYPLSLPPSVTQGLLGECSWGLMTCNGGFWGTCGGGKGKELVEDCSKTDGKDRDCNGKTNLMECTCQSGTSAPCGTCGKGTKQCIGGVYTSCSGDETQATYCLDADGDTVCSATCALQCPSAPHGSYKLKTNCYQGGAAVDCADNDASRGQNKPEQCSASDEDCNGNAYNGFSWPNGLGFGAACTNGQKGSCVRSGTNNCASSSMTGCSAATVSAPGGWVTSPVSGSYDTTCDGIIQYQKDASVSSFTPAVLFNQQATSCTLPSTYNCSAAASYAGLTGSLFWLFIPCASHVVGTPPAPDSSATDSVPSGYSFRFGQVPNCGSKVGYALCVPSGINYINPSAASDLTYYTQACQ